MQGSTEDLRLGFHGARLRPRTGSREPGRAPRARDAQYEYGGQRGNDDEALAGDSEPLRKSQSTMGATMRAKLFRARFRRLFTVPRFVSVISAISS